MQVAASRACQCGGLRPPAMARRQAPPGFLSATTAAQPPPAVAALRRGTCLHTPRARLRSLRARAAADPSPPSSDDILRKYGLTPSGSPSSSGSSKPAPLQPQRTSAPLAAAAGNGVFLLLLLNVVLFVLDHVLHVRGISGLYLNHARPQWYQWVTHAFCHASWGHLSMNLFNLCVFGKMVEETEGAFGVIFAYLITAVGAAAAAVALQPAVHHGAVTVSLGASGAIFGLFAVSVLTRLSWDPRRLLEGLILGQFVVRQVLQEASAQAAGGLTVGGLQVGHIAHLGGALAGVLLVWLLSKLPDPDAAASK